MKPCRDEDLDGLLDRFDGGRSFEVSHDGHHYGRHFSAVFNPYLFASRRLDTFSNLYWNRHRMYNSRLGRFESSDPISFNGGLNLWNYAGNNPQAFTDPFGLDLHHIIPQALWKGLEVPREVKKIFANEVVDAGYHLYGETHRAYSAYLEKLWNESFKGIKPQEMTEKMARDFVTKVKNNPQAKNLLEKILKEGALRCPPPRGRFKKILSLGGIFFFVLDELFGSTSTAE